MARNTPDADENGDFPYGPQGLGASSISNGNLRIHDLVAWYRNPTGATGSMRVPWRRAQVDKSMYPDFHLVPPDREGIRPSIIDPHGLHSG